MSENYGIPLLGDLFPEMTVNTTHGVIKLPDDMKGKWFVLFSHPADFTPVCTTEFYAFAIRANKFKELNCELIGLSIDQVFSHIKWIEWIEENLNQEIPFPVIADDIGKVAKTLGMVQSGKGNNTVRAVFIVDDNGIIRLILYYPQEVGRNVDEVLRSLEALQIATKYKVAAPHNWPNNELIKDRVIIPPPKSREQVKEIMKKYPDGYDWWFRHKKLER
ncbi:MAG: peroxiredoxin [Candidatus Helarchaeota archaeon]